MRMSILKPATLLATISIYLIACVAIPPAKPPAHKTLKPGMKFTLNETLEVLPQKAAVNIQHGKIISDKQIEVYQPNCRLVVHGLDNAIRKIEPESFSISKITFGTEIVMAKPIHLAGLSIHFSSVGGGGGDGGATAEIYTTYFYLKSDNQTLVSHISCSHWEDATDGAYLTEEQITATLGNILVIQKN